MILSVCCTAVAQTADNILVSVSASIGDQTLHDRVVSAVNRELRNLGDITVVDDGKCVRTLSTSSASSVNRRRMPRPESSSPVEFSSVIPIWIIKEECKEGKLAHLTMPTLLRIPAGQMNSKVNLNTLVRMDAPDEVERTIRDIVAKFDVDVLNPERQSRQSQGASSKATQ